MDKVHTSYCRWVRGYVIPGKVVQYKKDTDGTGREAQHKHKKILRKGLL